MENTSETEEYEERKPQQPDNSAANLFAQIQAAHESIDLNVSAMGVATVAQSSESPPHLPNSASNVLTLDVFQAAMNSIHDKLSAVQEANNSMKSLICQLNAKVDFIGSSSSSSTARDSGVKLKQAYFNPVRCEEDLKELEAKCRDEDFVKASVKTLGRINGKNKCVGEGGTVCLKIIDKLFTREFLTTCSWTGVSRSKNDGEICVPKIAFQKFDGVINLFYQIVAFSDPTYPLESVKNFLHYCLKNSKHRLELKGTKKSSARKRPKLSDDSSKSADADSNEEESEEETAEEVVVYEGFIDETQ